jgi:hypothetical protein
LRFEAPKPQPQLVPLPVLAAAAGVEIIPATSSSPMVVDHTLARQRLAKPAISVGEFQKL